MHKAHVDRSLIITLQKAAPSELITGKVMVGKEKEKRGCDLNP
jgi:hypothetical protein